MDEVQPQEIDVSDASHVPLTEWENEPTLADLKQNYQDADIEHDAQVTKIDGYLDHLHTKGTARRPKVKGRSNVHPKVIRKQAEWRYPSLSEPFLSTDDLFNAEPETHMDRKAAQQNGLILNYQFNKKLKKVSFINEYVRTGVDEGTIMVRTGWDFQEKEVPGMKLMPTDDPEIIAAFTQFQQNPQLLQQAPEELQVAFAQSMQAGEWLMWQKVMVKKTVKNQPTLDVCDYRSVILDPTCEGDVDKAQFAIFEIETTLSDLRKSSINYKNLDNINIEQNAAETDAEGNGDVEEPDFSFKDDPRKKIVIREYWGFWDINDTGMTEPFVAAWCGNTTIRMEKNPFPDEKLPLVLVQLLPCRKKIYGEPDGALLVENQEIIGATTRGMIDIMGRSANGQQGYRKDALDYTNQVKFQRGEDYEYNAGVNPQDAFFMHKYPEIPQSAPLMIQFQQSDAESLTGVKAFHGAGGITGAALGENATGIRSAMDATSKRELDILRRLKEGIIGIGQKISSMNAVFLSEEEIIRITDEEFITIKRDDLAGDFDVSLNISTAEADNEKASELAFMLQTTGPNADPGEVRIIRAEIARLRGMPDLAKRIEEYKPQPDPFEEQMKQLEMQKLTAEIQKLQSEARENMAEATLDEAAAREKGSNADLKDLEFLEQGDGTTHNRNLDVIEKQSDAQTNMKVVEGLMKNEYEQPKQVAKGQ